MLTQRIVNRLMQDTTWYMVWVLRSQIIHLFNKKTESKIANREGGLLLDGFASYVWMQTPFQVPSPIKNY